MLGEKLRKERERQRLSIKDIEQGTSIRGLYLEAIEKEDWATLPGDVYAKGFVRNYANFLKIDADACVAQYNEEVQGSPAAPPEPEPVYKSPNAESIFPSGDDYHDRVEKKHESQNKLLLVLVALVIAGGAYFAFGADDTSGKTEPPQKQTAQKADTEKKDTGKAEKTPAAPAPAAPAQPASTGAPGTTPTAAQGATPSAAQTAAPGGGDIDLRAHFTDRCWMRVIADGQVVYEGTGEKGQSMAWKAKNQIVITAGNAGAVDITQNGKLLGNPGDYGSVVEKTYSKATLPQ